MEIKTLSVGELQTNCYFIWDRLSSECFIIDPGDDADFITSQVLELKLKPKAVLLTHGHYDHCLACLELKLNFNIPIFLNPKDNFLYQNAAKSAEHWSSSKALKQPPTSPLPKEIKLGDETITVIPSPGHTPGSVCFSFGSTLITGDTLFADGVGRTDLSYSSAQELKRSLNTISKLSPETEIFPGHGDSSTLSNEETCSNIQNYI
jgi:glyoxylase-like metal-dependent hydrolase (beta-lactamase superfamily II)